jgi:quinol monooxygenase YgiN
MKVGVLAKVTAISGRRRDLVAELEGLVDEIESVPTAEVYAFHLDPNDDDVIWFYEVFTDQRAVQAHAGSERMRLFGERTKDLVTGPPQVTLLTPVKGKGVPF